MRHRTLLIGVFLTMSAGLVALVAWVPDFAPQRPPLEIPPAVPSTPASAPRVPVPPALKGARWSPPVRVNLTPDAVTRLTIAIDGPWELRAVGSMKSLAKAPRLEPCEVTLTANGFRLGRAPFPGTRLELVAAKPPAIWVNDHQYRGTVRLHRRDDKTFVAVNVVPLEDYVASVVDSEMPATFGDEARKAQAIVARTYALWRIHEARGHPEFDVFNSSRSQKYLGFQYRTADGRRLAGESDSSRRLTRETRGIACAHNGKIFCTYYCAVCGGQTTRGDQVFADAGPPHQSVACDYCGEADLYRWSTRLGRDQAARLLRSYFLERGEPFGTLRTLAKSDPRDGSPAATFNAEDGERTRRIAAADLRRILPASILFSPFFTVRAEGADFRFDGRGHGHGAGLCQWGARGMAAAGKDCYDILRHYYQGVSFVTVLGPGL